MNQRWLFSEDAMLAYETLMPSLLIPLSRSLLASQSHLSLAEFSASVVAMAGASWDLSISSCTRTQDEIHFKSKGKEKIVSPTLIWP
jgi:hypothetical protein